MFIKIKEFFPNYQNPMWLSVALAHLMFLCFIKSSYLSHQRSPLTFLINKDLSHLQNFWRFFAQFCIKA